MSIIFVVIIKLPVLSECFLFSDVAKTHLERMSRFWPLVIGETIIFNMASVRQFCKGGGVDFSLLSLLSVNHIMFARNLIGLWNSSLKMYVMIFYF